MLCTSASSVMARLGQTAAKSSSFETRRPGLSTRCRSTAKVFGRRTISFPSRRRQPRRKSSTKRSNCNRLASACAGGSALRSVIAQPSCDMVNVRQVRRQPLEAYPIQAAILKSCRRPAAVTSRSLSVGERQLGPFWVKTGSGRSALTTSGAPPKADDPRALRRTAPAAALAATAFGARESSLCVSARRGGDALPAGPQAGRRRQPLRVHRAKGPDDLGRLPQDALAPRRRRQVPLLGPSAHARACVWLQACQ